ncbi:crossover junction endodeoxyribonuclease RuvC, partial [bacterium]|nr:crossover junction endodeoxyribonuclease RuvC [bacterium]
MIVLGIDPGLVNTGWGVVSQEEIISGEQIKAYGCIKTRSDCFLPQR